MIQSIRALLKRWRYAPENHARDLRLDLIRGYCIAVMTINHLDTFPAWTRSFTGGGKLWVSAAEGFVLVSGFVLGMLYRKRTQERGWHWSVSKIGRRALQLYLLGVFGQIALSTGDYLLRLFRGRSSPVPLDYPSLVTAAIYQTRYVFPGVDLLPLYALLLPYGLLVVHLLTRRQLKWVVIISLFIWCATYVDPNWLSVFHTHFPFKLWQLPFTIAVVAGYYADQLRAWLARLPGCRSFWPAILVSSTALMIFTSYQVAFHGWFPEIEWLDASGPLFAKPHLSLGRVFLSIWVFTALYYIVSRLWGVLNPLFGWLLLPLGQDSLTAYLIQAILTYGVARMPGYPFPGHSPALMGFLHLGAVLLVWSAIRVMDKLSPLGKALIARVRQLEFEKETET